jgi:hypothetical protein
MKIKDLDGLGRIGAGLLMLGAALLMTGFMSG